MTKEYNQYHTEVNDAVEHLRGTLALQGVDVQHIVLIMKEPKGPTMGQYKRWASDTDLEMVQHLRKVADQVEHCHNTPGAKLLSKFDEVVR